MENEVVKVQVQEEELVKVKEINIAKIQQASIQLVNEEIQILAKLNGLEDDIGFVTGAYMFAAALNLPKSYIRNVTGNFWNYEGKAIIKSSELHSLLRHLGAIEEPLEITFEKQYYYLDKKLKEDFGDIRKKYIEDTLAKFKEQKKLNKDTKFKVEQTYNDYFKKIVLKQLSEDKINEDYEITTIPIIITTAQTEFKPIRVYDWKMTVKGKTKLRNQTIKNIEASVTLSSLANTGYVFNKGEPLKIKKAWNNIETMMFFHAMKQLIQKNALSPALAGLVDNSFNHENGMRNDGDDTIDIEITDKQ
jgi:hypothetical protein